MLFSMTYNLAVWFMETYGDWKYIADDFTMPKEVHQADLKSVIEDQEKRLLSYRKACRSNYCRFWYHAARTCEKISSCIFNDGME